MSNHEKIKYITNKELLAEIHKSKNSYCFYEKPEYSNYDAIVTDLSTITPEFITQVYDKKFAFATKKNLELPVKENLVFRLMTDEHIPDETDLKKRKRNTEETSIRTCFHPFKHYIMRDGSPVEVGRSHWKDGAFSDVHGKMTNRLAIMLMLLVERYSRRANWRGYCVSEDTEALTQRGWLDIDEITENDIILSYDLEDGKLKWSNIKSIFRDDYDGNMFHLTVKGMDALVTPGHRFITQDGLKPVEYILEKDKIIMTGLPLDGPDEIYSDDFVEIVGWAITEGSYITHKTRSPTIRIYQNEGPYAERIRNCLTRLEVRFSERSKINENNTNIAFNILSKNAIIEKILSVSSGRVLTMNFILSLSQRQKELLISTMIDADGWRTHQEGAKSPHVGYCQKDKKHLDTFLALCTLAGKRCTFNKRDVITEVNHLQTHVYNVTIFTDRANFSRVENIDFHDAKRNGKIKGRGKINHPNEPTIPYKGRVWCPETEYGTFVSRRNGTIFTQGQTYNDEMRSHALLQLSEVGLRFNESKSDNPNPFAFYTTIIKNCLAGDTMILTREHGSVPIEEVSEQDVTLLDGNGDWVKCHIYDHGIQETELTYFQGGYQRIGIRSTLNHGWVSNGERVETKDFHGKNTKIDDLRHNKIVLNPESYRKGVVHGLVYGDGHRIEEAQHAFGFTLCSHHDSIAPYMVKYSSWASGKQKQYISYYIGKAWTDLKAFPQNPGEDLDYLLGFLRGWFAADGCLSKAQTPTLCGDVNEYEWFKKWGPLVGWHVNGYTKLAEETNFGKRKKESCNFHLRKSSMEKNDFIIEQHKERWKQRPFTRKGNEQGNKYDWNAIEKMREEGMKWADIATHFATKRNLLLSSYSQYKKARDFKNNGEEREWIVYRGREQTYERRFEHVYCPVVETTHTFALSCGIHGFNCFTRILNNEKKVQHIRDDLLIMADKSPSYTRQIEHEAEQKFEENKTDVPETTEKAVVPKKRGRKPKSEKLAIV